MLDTVKKANSSIGFLRQNLQIHQKHIKANVYKALLWPQNGYASTMWDPFTQENQNKIDIVQRRAARFAWNNYRCEAIVMRMHVLWAKWVNEIWKITFLVETIKSSITFITSLLSARARPISDMKSQPGLFVTSIPGPSATTTCMVQRIAFPDTP